MLSISKKTAVLAIISVLSLPAIQASTPPANCIRDVHDYVVSSLILSFYSGEDAHGYESLDKIRQADSKAYDDIMQLKQRIMGRLGTQGQTTGVIARIIQEEIELFVLSKSNAIMQAQQAAVADAVTTEVKKLTKIIIPCLVVYIRILLEELLSEKLQVRWRILLLNRLAKEIRGSGKK